MLLKKYFPAAFILFLLSCHSAEQGNNSGIDSCSVAKPFENVKITESMVSPGYSGELNNYRGEDNSKLDFKHIYEKGKLIKSIFYYENGNIQEEYSFKCGSLHGLQKQYHENGTLALKTPCRYGRAEGLAEGFSKKGILRIQILYKADSVISRKVFDENGLEISK